MCMKGIPAIIPDDLHVNKTLTAEEIASFCSLGCVCCSPFWKAGISQSWLINLQCMGQSLASSHLQIAYCSFCVDPDNMILS